MAAPSVVVALLLAAGLLLVLLAFARLRRRRPLSAAGAAGGGCICLLLAALAFALALNLYTYRQLTGEQPVAQLYFERIGAHRYRVQLNITNGPTRTFVLAGSQWRLEARVLKWQPWAVLLGFEARYRLDRLSGRYGRIGAARRHPGTVYDLSRSRGLDVWQAAQYLPQWLNPVDTRYGSGAYLPMADGARYSVSLSQTGGLIARPANAAAKAAVQAW